MTHLSRIAFCRLQPCLPCSFVTCRKEPQLVRIYPCTDTSTFAMQGKGHGAVVNDKSTRMYGSNVVTRTLRRLIPRHYSTIANFPSHTVINAATIQQDQLLGEVLAKHLGDDAINQEEAVKLWLVVHRAMGPHSPYHPYLQTLPSKIDSPVHYSVKQLRELAGTPLYHAALVCSHASC